MDDHYSPRLCFAIVVGGTLALWLLIAVIYVVIGLQ